MRFVLAGDLRPGMLIGRTFYSHSLCITFKKGVLLTDAHIRTISRIKVNGIYIDDLLTEANTSIPLIEDAIRVGMEQEMRSLFAATKPWLTVYDVEDTIYTIIEQIAAKPVHIVNLLALKNFDDYTYHHAIDVCILSVVMGLQTKLSYSVLYNLALAAIFHDIGKLLINPDIIKKPGKLTAEEHSLMQTHPALGAVQMQKIAPQRMDITNGILQHHERCDGKGYPEGIPSDKITLFAKIIALADVFDAMTADRRYQRAIQASEAIEYIDSNAGTQFDSALAALFTGLIAVYPIGQTVRLSNGMTGVVTANYREATLRPKVMLKHDIPGRPPRYVDLKNDADAQHIVVSAVVP